MSYTFTNIKRFKRAAKWPNGDARQCSRCAVEKRRTRPVVVTGIMKYAKAKTRMPFAYCDEHDIIKERGDNDTTDG